MLFSASLHSVFLGGWTKGETAHQILQIPTAGGKPRPVHRHHRKVSEVTVAFDLLEVDDTTFYWGFELSGMLLVYEIDRQDGSSRRVSVSGANTSKLELGAHSWAALVDGHLQSQPKSSAKMGAGKEIRAGDSLDTIAVHGNGIAAGVMLDLWYLPNIPGAVLYYQTDSNDKTVLSTSVRAIAVALNSRYVFAVDTQSDRSKPSSWGVLLRFDRPAP